ncbi:hypothetical protein Taro_027063 [Colocasia esculenta]|uniref:Thaumatin-like protein 1 n=1 Tax=Colocasia esculenta TaxID=4460 RepID=A0A843VJ09_COLES|nr:hypothetical protein [Colocasia esculenta]
MGLFSFVCFLFVSFLFRFSLVLLSVHSFGRDQGTAHAATFTFVNRCGYTVWPGVLSNAGNPSLGTTGFELPPGGSRAFLAPTGWSGRFWGRTGCTFDGSSGGGACATGDCGSGQVECNGAGAAPPATLAEFTLSGSGGQDFYDVSLVDGYNLPMVVETSGGSGGCAATGCAADLNGRCPAELRTGNTGACRSACEAFGSPEYCCSGVYANPSTCQPSVYSQMFKSACPRAYSYAFDDPTSTFTCAGADYLVSFCPSSVGSLKSSQDLTPATAGTTAAATTTPRTTTEGSGVMLENDAWLASLATGSATTRSTAPLLHHAALLVLATALATLLPATSSLAL